MPVLMLCVLWYDRHGRGRVLYLEQYGIIYFRYLHSLCKDNNKASRCGCGSSWRSSQVGFSVLRFYDTTIIVHISRQYISSLRQVRPECHCPKLYYAILFNDFLAGANIVRNYGYTSIRIRDIDKQKTETEKKFDEVTHPQHKLWNTMI